MSHSDTHNSIPDEQSVSSPPKLIRTMSDDDIAIDAFVEHLKKQGHLCVSIDNVNSNKVNWCKKTPCSSIK